MARCRSIASATAFSAVSATVTAIFATIIVQGGYMEGLRARGGPEAVGTAATSAVVKSAFLIIVADLVATAMFYLMGWSAAG